jgi:hypothetical protein
LVLALEPVREPEPEPVRELVLAQELVLESELELEPALVLALRSWQPAIQPAA